MPFSIQQKIAQGEHQEQDFKFRIDDARKLARSFAAFANTDGGRLLIGVKDNGKIAGVRSDEEYHMAEAAAEVYCKPPVPFETQLWQVDGKQVLEITIPKSDQRPHQCQMEDGRYRAFVRRADQNLQANRVLLKLWKKGKQRRDTGLAFSATEELLFKYLREHESITFSKFCRVANISHHKAEFILVQLLSWDILEMHIAEKSTTYSLSSKSPF